MLIAYSAIPQRAVKYLGIQRGLMVLYLNNADKSGLS